MRVRTGPTGAVINSYASLPFGDCLYQTGGSNCNGLVGGTPAHFTDQDRDSETGLDHFMFRQYSSVQGRWMRPDPAGMAAVDATNPQTWNRYTYVANNPVNGIDSLGLMMCLAGECISDDDTGFYNELLGDLYGLSLEDLGYEYVDSHVTVTDTMPGDLDTTDTGVSAADSFISDSESSAPAAAQNGGPDPVRCARGLNLAHANQGAVARANQNWNVLQAAADHHSIDPALLAAVAIRETGFNNVAERKKGGMGRGYFQIDIGKNPNVSETQAFDPNFAANFAAAMLGSNMDRIAAAHPNLNDAQLLQATAASYNFGVGNISGNPNTIDKGSTGGNYGSDVVMLMNCF